jgi:hypothetical protein
MKATRYYAIDKAGETAVIEMAEDGTVVAASSALYYEDVTPENMELCETHPDGAEWYNQHPDDWRIKQ